METDEKFEETLREFARLLPEDLRACREDLRRNLRAALSAALARMDLVTRGEFDVQAELLARTRALVEEMENTIRELEERLDRDPHESSPPNPKND